MNETLTAADMIKIGEALPTRWSLERQQIVPGRLDPTIHLTFDGQPRLRPALVDPRKAA